MSRRVVAAVPLALVPALGVVQGFSAGAWVWSGALAARGAAVGIVLAEEIAVPVRAWGVGGRLGRVSGWTILSAIWSVLPAQSVL